jgi:hypothetical protein
LRVIRFLRSLRALGGARNLADHAAAYGYADQAQRRATSATLPGGRRAPRGGGPQGPFL